MAKVFKKISLLKMTVSIVLLTGLLASCDGKKASEDSATMETKEIEEADTLASETTDTAVVEVDSTVVEADSIKTE